MKIEWTEGYEIRTAIENDKIIISANKEGLLNTIHWKKDPEN